MSGNFKFQTANFRSARRRGAALIIILSFVVLLTGLVLAYFSFSILQLQISSASANQSIVGIFAQGAVNVIVNDLKREITEATRSDQVTAGARQVYFPKLPEHAVPARVGTDNALPNLVKRSAYNRPFYPAPAGGGPSGPSRAASLSSTSPAQNGRFISPARWNAALLLPKAVPASNSDLTPSSVFVPPDWILLARDGSNPAAWNNNLRWNNTDPATVVGRFAYSIYDEGGLLDVNAAGFPPGSDPGLAADKGSLAFADLMAIPGMTANANAALVGWRNFASTQPGGAFPAYTFNDTAKTNYFNFVREITSGFLRTSNLNLTGGKSDRMFVSRQQLIQFLTKGVAANPAEKADLQNALQYLGTFSRDLEQPSFRPDPARPKNTTHQWATAGATSPGYGGNDAYDPAGARQDLINPALLAVRDANGDPVMKRRFPLSRLALVKPNPPEAEAARIHDYFGLKWDNANKRWNYDHGAANQILKLSEIPAGREPDFFETLKAVINCDSLGKQYGGTGYTDSIHAYTSGAAGVDGMVNCQIIQIGANLIDQYDRDSYPTAVAFDALRIFYGVENLPYLTGWVYSWYRMKHLTAADIDPARQPPKDSSNNLVFPWETWVMYQPVLWNPHAPDATLDTARAPTNFRVTAGNRTGIAVTVSPTVRPNWWGAVNPVSRYPGPSGTTSASWSQTTLDPDTSILTFTATPNKDPNVPASFQEPYRLLYQYPPGSNADSAYAGGKFSLDALGAVADPVLAASDAKVDGKTIIGFFSGKAWAGPWNAATTGSVDDVPNCLATGYASTNDVQFTLQYQAPSGDWLPYDVIDQVYAGSVQTSAVSTIDNLDSGTQIRAFATGFRADPRTDRWGQFAGKIFPLAADPSGAATPPDNGIHTGAWVYKLPEATTLSPNAGVNSGFIYRLARNGTGKPLVDWSTAIFPSDLSVNLNTGSSSGASAYIPGGKFYYNDPDHVLRRASGGYMTGGSKDGLPFHTANYQSRPVVLNRAFRSVAEMGYSFSGTPWKEINFFMPESGDSALLDAFCMNELDNAPSDVTVAGRVNLNTRQPKVLQALIQGVSKAEGGTISNAEAQRAAEALVAWTSDITSMSGGSPQVPTKGPLRNRSELVGKFVKAVTYASPPSTNTPNIGYDGKLSYSGYSSMLTAGPGGVFTASADAAIKRRRESVVRALADSGNTRTWNLLIDVVAQIGRYPGSAQALDQFLVEGETRVWVHLAIDRYTGEVITKLVEPVSE